MNDIFITVLFTIGMTISGSMGAYCFKRFTITLNQLSIVNLLKNRWLYFGGILYISASVLNIFLLRTLDYSVVYPLTALTYVWTILIARIFLKEPFNKYKIIAIALIGVGIMLVTR